MSIFLVALIISALVVVFGFIALLASQGNGQAYGFLAVFLGIIGIPVSLMLQDHFAEKIPCEVGPANKSVVQWSGHRSGKNPAWWIFATTDDPEKFCKIYNKDLYSMGLEYPLQHTYKGNLVDRP